MGHARDADAAHRMMPAAPRASLMTAPDPACEPKAVLFSSAVVWGVWFHTRASTVYRYIKHTSCAHVGHTPHHKHYYEESIHGDDLEQ
jgi:hypothetical protein